MRRMPAAAFLWPALPQIWRRGAWSDLAWAVGFGIALNLALLASVIWTELWPEAGRRLAWWAIGAIWVASGLYGVYWARCWSVACSENDGGLYAEALGEYLRANWFEAEKLLGRLIAANPRDHDARLMLATLLRHTRRWGEAREVLDCLARYDGAGKWEWEIACERQLLDAARAASASAGAEVVAESSAAKEAA